MEDEKKMNENDIDFVDALQQHVCKLIEELDKYDPVSEEYVIVKDSVEKFSAITMRIKEVEFKVNSESDNLNYQMKVKEAELEAAKIAKEAENRLRSLELQEEKRWHNIEMCLRIATTVTTIASITLFGATTLLQTRMNYIDNVYDTSPASRMILNAIGNMAKLPNK